MNVSLTVNAIAALSFHPLLIPNVIFCILFAVLLFCQVILCCIFYHYYGFAIGILGGLLLEMLGYIAKVRLSSNQHDKSFYIMQVYDPSLSTSLRFL